MADLERFDPVSSPVRRPPSSLRPPRISVFAAVLIMLGSACGEVSRSESEFAHQIGSGVTIAVTTSIWADVVGNLLCEPGMVVPLIGPGSDPHGFQPTLAQAEVVRAADLVIANGGGLEGPMVDLLEDREASDQKTIYATDLITTSIDNPHIWLDPRMIIDVAEGLEPTLIEAGVDLADVEQCVIDYIAELEALDREISTKLEGVRPADRKLVTNHEALDHFADRYGFAIIGTVLSSSSTLAEVSPNDLEDLRTLVDKEQVHTLFTEAGHSTAEMEAVASQLDDVQIVALSIESLGEPGSETDTYLNLMRSTADQVAEALQASS